jgi:hypothetical protein
MTWIIRTHGDLQGVGPRSGKPLPPSEIHFPVAGGDACLWLDAAARRAADRHTLIIVLPELGNSPDVYDSSRMTHELCRYITGFTALCRFVIYPIREPHAVLPHALNAPTLFWPQHCSCGDAHRMRSRGCPGEYASVSIVST